MVWLLCPSLWVFTTMSSWHGQSSICLPPCRLHYHGQPVVTVGTQMVSDRNMLVTVGKPRVSCKPHASNSWKTESKWQALC